jgi:hypothetical protein
MKNIKNSIISLGNESNSSIDPPLIMIVALEVEVDDEVGRIVVN